VATSVKQAWAQIQEGARRRGVDIRTPDSRINLSGSRIKRTTRNLRIDLTGSRVENPCGDCRRGRIWRLGHRFAGKDHRESRQKEHAAGKPQANVLTQGFHETCAPSRPAIA